MKKHRYLYILLIVVSIACKNEPKQYISKLEKSLDLSKKNRTELEKVLTHYSKNIKDSLKYKAAEFLIENMLGKSYRNNSPFLNVFLIKLDSLRSLQTEIRESDLKTIWKACESQNYNKFSERKFDVRTVTSKLLINNIEEAFSIWKKVP